MYFTKYLSAAVLTGLCTGGVLSTANAQCGSRCAPIPASPAPAQPAPAQPAPAQAAMPPALFAAPPASGEISGETGGYGVRGFSLRIPESHIQMPTLQFPSLVRFRRNPEMHVDGGRAPLVSGVPAAYAPLAAAGQMVVTPQSAAPAAAPAKPNPTTAAPASPPDCCVPPMVPPAQSSNDDLVNELQIARDELARYRQELERIQQALSANLPAEGGDSAVESAVELPVHSTQRTTAKPMQTATRPLRNAVQNVNAVNAERVPATINGSRPRKRATKSQDDVEYLTKPPVSLPEELPRLDADTPAQPATDSLNAAEEVASAPVTHKIPSRPTLRQKIAKLGFRK